MKHILAIVLSGLLFWGIHSQVLFQFFSVGTFDSIIEQHAVLLLVTLFSYITIAISSRIIPAQTSFVFLGVLIIKVIIAGIFVHKQGWLDDPETVTKRAIFLCFYFGYLICLLLVSIKIIKRINP